MKYTIENMVYDALDDYPNISNRVRFKFTPVKQLYRNKFPFRIVANIHNCDYSYNPYAGLASYSDYSRSLTSYAIMSAACYGTLRDFNTSNFRQWHTVMRKGDAKIYDFSGLGIGYLTLEDLKTSISKHALYLATMIYNQSRGHPRAINFNMEFEIFYVETESLMEKLLTIAETNNENSNGMLRITEVPRKHMIDGYPYRTQIKFCYCDVRYNDEDIDGVVRILESIKNLIEDDDNIVLKISTSAERILIKQYSGIPSVYLNFKSLDDAMILFPFFGTKQIKSLKTEHFIGEIK